MRRVLKQKHSLLQALKHSSEPREVLATRIQTNKLCITRKLVYEIGLFGRRQLSRVATYTPRLAPGIQGLLPIYLTLIGSGQCQRF